MITVFVENDIDDDLKLSHKTIEALCESVITNDADLEKALPLIKKIYELNKK